MKIIETENLSKYYGKNRGIDGLNLSIEKGEIFTQENLKSIRPGFGLATKYTDDILGKKARCDIGRGTPMDWSLIE